MAYYTEVNLMLIGRSGNGKSATGNSILRRKCFMSTGSSMSVTNKIDCEVGKFDGRKIKVVDVPGVCDTSTDNERGVKLVVRCLQEAVYVSPDGYNAFILVIKYGSRFTGEELKTVEFLKKVFGENFVKQFCLLVLSCGDAFVDDYKSESISFKNWCSKQTGKFQQLLEECNYRIVLFDNITKDNYIKSKQLLKLLKEVDIIGANRKRYTDINFRRARQSRERLHVDNKLSKIKEESLCETSLLLDKLSKVQASNDHKTKISPLEKILAKEGELLKNLKSTDNGTGELKDIIDHIKSIGIIATDEKKVSEKFAEEEEKLKKQKEDMQAEREKLERQKREAEEMKENERKKVYQEIERQKNELEKKRREQEEREKQFGREMMEKKKLQEQRLEQEEMNQKTSRETAMVNAAVNFAADWIPGGNYVKKAYDVSSSMYNWWYGY